MEQARSYKLIQGLKFTHSRCSQQDIISIQYDVNTAGPCTRLCQVININGEQKGNKNGVDLSEYNRYLNQIWYKAQKRHAVNMTTCAKITQLENP